MLLWPFELRAVTIKPLDDLPGDALELLVEMEPKGARQVGVLLRRSPDGAESAPVYLDLEKKKGAINQESGPFTPDGAAVTLRIFVDRSVVEAFADNRQAVVRRIYPSWSDSLGGALFTSGGAARVRRVFA